MNKKIIIAEIVGGILILVLLGVLVFVKPKPAPEGSVSNENDSAIRAQVTAFGTTLKNVALLGTPENVKKDLQKNYESYLTPELLLAWQNNPSLALGRQTSSPWPDRINIVSVVGKNGSYTVDGNVIELTSADAPQEPAAVYPITLAVEKRHNSWLIASVTKGAYSELPQKITLDGTWECLPHKNTNGPQTMECAFGVQKIGSGEHYAVDTNLMSTFPIDYATGQKVRIQGRLTPIEQLNSDIWQRYNVKGIISATTIEKI